MNWPRIIQGGMGAGVSGWRLARAVAMHGQLGVVSGTALDTLLIRVLQDGDDGGHVRRALGAFPLQRVSAKVLERYFRADGREARDERAPRYALAPLLRARLSPEREALAVVANFVEVYLAKEGHHGLVGINYLEKIQMATLPSLYGAMLAGVDVVLMGAGIPAEIPSAIAALTRHEPASISLDVLDGGDERYHLRFDPSGLWTDAGVQSPRLQRPRFLPIVSSATLARALLKKAPNGGIDGFVVEAPTAGGHNAPPRGDMRLSQFGEPIYSDRDMVDPAQMVALGVPFWLAGGRATSERLAHALACGAAGIQVGTAFAFCDESGLTRELKSRVIEQVLSDEAEASVFTDPVASPTGYPFKVVELKGTLSESSAFADRPRLCDLGYLRRAYRKPDGTLDYRCPGEPVEDYVRKGGKAEDTIGRKCLCNALVANIGLGQRRTDGYEELPMLTAGDDLRCLRQFMAPGTKSYSAEHVLESLLGAVHTAQGPA